MSNFIEEELLLKIADEFPGFVGMDENHEPVLGVGGLLPVLMGIVLHLKEEVEDLRENLAKLEGSVEELDSSLLDVRCDVEELQMESGL